MPTDSSVREREPIDPTPTSAPATTPTPAEARATVDASLAELANPGASAPPAEAEAESQPARGPWRLAGPIVLLTLSIKALIYLFGYLAVETIDGRVFHTIGERLAIWNAWDAEHYLDIAEHGYQTTGDAANFVVFFPGYPSAVRLLHTVLPGDLLTSAFVISGIGSVAAAVLIALLARKDGADDAQSTRAAWFLLIFPTAYFLHVPYTESMFLSLVLGAFLAARTGHWATAGILGALATFTRLNGMLLIPALAVEAFLQYRRTRRLDPAWLWIALVGAGFAAYLALNQHLFGDPFHFQDIQRNHWGRHLQSPITSVTGMIEGSHGYKPADKQMYFIQELLFLSVGLVAGLLALRYSRPSYAAWILLNVLLFASTSWIQSTPRYTLTLFPIFLMLAQATGRQLVAMIASAWSLMLMAWFTTLFALNYWAF